MTFDDDTTPAKTNSYTIGENLEGHSIAELETLLAALEKEIARIKTEIINKTRSAEAADAFFKK